MTAMRAQLGRLPILAGLVAVASTLGLVAAVSTTDGYLAAAMERHDARLEAISERAERIDTLSRNIRKASLTSQADVHLPFGGFVGAASRVEPGARLKLRPSDVMGVQTLEVVSAHKVAPTIDLTTDATRNINLMLVSGRAVETPNAPLIRFLVAVTPDNPATAAIIDQRSL
ncbi:MAG: hypothetical protein ACR2PI_22340 [Hyphomicrobiaceae bacterium]